MTFWTMDESDGFPAVTLCERHALEATNIGCSLLNLGPYDTMQAAAAELDALAAIFGGGSPDAEFGFHTSEVGYCQECRAELEEFAHETAGDVA